jgi:hypothetical protein
VPEAEIFKMYQERWGVVCPPNQKAGSGWWRYRYQLAADAGSVLWLDYKDRAPMGAAYNYSMAEYEKMDDSALLRIAAEQNNWFYNSSAVAEQTLRVITEALG